MVVNGFGRIRHMVMAKALPDRERGVCCSIELEVPQARAEELATVLKALADPTRVQMILSLRQAKEPICICDFTATLSLSQPTVSHHGAKLREAGLDDPSRQASQTTERLKHPVHAN